MRDRDQVRLARISTLIDAERYANAVAACDKALRRDGDSPDLHARRGAALKMLDRPDEAIEALWRAHALQPERAEFAAALGELLATARGDYIQAEPLFVRAVASDPSSMRGYFGLARCRIWNRLVERGSDESHGVLPSGADRRMFWEAVVVQLCNHGRYAEARAVARDLVERHEDSLYGQLGLSRIADEAEHDYRLARAYLDAAQLKLFTNPLFHLFFIAHLVKTGAWEEASLRVRALMKRFGSAFPRFDGPAPNWDGAPLAGKTVMLDTRLERGYGDAIQFCRFGARLKSCGARVGIRARTGLESLFEHVDGVDYVIPRTDPAGDVDYMIEMSAVWLFLGLDMTEVAAGTPYLRATQDAMREWSAVLDANTGVRVGIAWLTSDARLANAYTAKNIPIACLEPLRRLDSVRLVSLHHFSARDELARVFGPDTVTEFGARLSGFMSTAALISHLDAVVTADTAVAHLAGALGKPTFILLPFSADWRWVVNRSDTPWYPTVRLIRQSAPGKWDGAVAECANALEELARSAACAERPLRAPRFGAVAVPT
jgi:tetratricopeptide (TPR) repeat protein